MELNQGLLSLREDAFRGCSSLISINLPTSLELIGPGGFQSCSSLQAIEIPSGVGVIQAGTFARCASLKKISLHNGLTDIQEYAFAGCTSLESVHLPESVEFLGTNPFGGCINLTSFTGKYSSSDNKSIVLNGVLISFAPKGIKDYTVPSGVTSIGDEAFIGNTYIESIKMESGVIEIGRFAFEECSSLSNVSIPKGLTTIMERAFSGCTKIENIELPESLIEIGEFSFCVSGIRKLYLPAGIKKIGWGAFESSSLSSFYCPALVPPELGKGAFDGIKQVTIYVPRNSVEVYKAAPVWRDYAKIIQEIPE